jgi:hypothetical protein
VERRILHYEGRRRLPAATELARWSDGFCTTKGAHPQFLHNLSPHLAGLALASVAAPANPSPTPNASPGSEGTAPHAHQGSPSLEREAHIDQTCDRFDAEWRAGRRPRVEDFLAGCAVEALPRLLRQLLLLELEYRSKNGEKPTRDDYRRRSAPWNAVGAGVAANRRWPLC